MSAKPTIEGFLAAAREAEENVEDLDYRIEVLKRELRALESLRVGAIEAKRAAHDAVRKACAEQVREEVTARERDIAYMKGIRLSVGDTVTPELKALLRNTPALHSFSIDPIE